MQTDWERSRRETMHYERKLRAIARHIDLLVKAHNASTPAGRAAIEKALRSYSELIRPWADATARKMIARINRLDLKTWREVWRTHGTGPGRKVTKDPERLYPTSEHERALMKYAKQIGTQLELEIESGPLGQVLKQRLHENVELITSLPTGAIETMNEWITTGISNGQRHEDIADRIYAELGGVTKSRATLIARTEVARTASLLMQTRSEEAGSTHYTWRSTEDGRVRYSHKILNHTIQAWDDPPLATDPDQKPVHAHPGQIWNCRCYAVPLFEDS